MTQAALKDKVMFPIPAGQHKSNTFCPASGFFLSSGTGGRKGPQTQCPELQGISKAFGKRPRETVSLWKTAMSGHLSPTSV